MRRVGTTLTTTFVRPVILFLLTITIGLVIIFTGGCTPRASDSAQLEMAVVEEALRGGDFQLRTEVEVPPGATPVTVGVYLVNAYDVNISANTYYLSGYLWMRWRGDIDPMSSEQTPAATSYRHLERSDPVAGDGTHCNGDDLE